MGLVLKVLAIVLGTFRVQVKISCLNSSQPTISRHMRSRRLRHGLGTDPEPSRLLADAPTTTAAKPGSPTRRGKEPERTMIRSPLAEVRTYTKELDHLEKVLQGSMLQGVAVSL